jgi:uncharacterized protein
MKRGPKMMALGDPRGFSGVFVFCDEKRETRAMNEVTDLLNTELDENFPINHSHQMETIDNAEVADITDETHSSLDGGPMLSKRIKSVAEEIEDELAQLGGATRGGDNDQESTTTHHPKKFINLKVQLKHKRARFMDVGGRGLGLVWIDQKFASITSPTSSSKPLDVVDLLEPIFEAALKDKKLPTRFTSRMVPLQSIVTASSSSIAEAVFNLSKSFLPLSNTNTNSEDAISTKVGEGEGQEDSSNRSHIKIRPVIPFKVEMRSRSNTTLKKDDVISTVSKALSGVSECYFRPDHLTHELLVIVEVVKFLAGVSIIKRSRWERFEKYNIRIAAESVEERAARFAKAASVRVQAQAKEERDFDNGDNEDNGRLNDKEGGVVMWFPPEKTSESQSIVTEQVLPGIEGSTNIPSSSIANVSHSAVAVHVPSLGRFCIGSHPDCFLSYEVENKVINMNHTFVLEGFRGKGFGAILVDKALDFAEQEGMTVNPSCSFVSNEMLKRKKWKKADAAQNTYSLA